MTTLHGPMRSLLRAHWPLLVVLAVAAAVRVAVAIAYRPAIFFGDSWAYLDLAFGGSPVGFAPDRPSGYPLLIDLLSVFGRSLGSDHDRAAPRRPRDRRARLRAAAAPAGAALAGDRGRRRRAARRVRDRARAADPRGGVLHARAGGVVLPRRRARPRARSALAASGALLAAAATMRTAALFAVPVWALYVVWAHRRPRLVGPAALGLMLPLLAYASWHAADTGRFGLTQADGWFLYGRVGEIADCGNADIPAAARPLCDRNARDRREGAAYHIWNADGPGAPHVRRHEHGPRHAGALERCAARVRPGDHPRPARAATRELVWDDFLRYFTPGRVRAGTPTSPSRCRSSAGSCAATRSRGIGGSPASSRTCSPPAKRVRDYHERVHVPRPLMAALAIAALLELAIAAAAFALRRPPPPRRREVFLLAGAALAMLLGTAATSEFVLRYLIPVVPLLVCGGVAAAADLAALAAASCPCRCAAGPAGGRSRRSPSARQRGSKNSTTPTTTIAVEMAISAGERSPERTGSGRRSRTAGTRRPSQGRRASGWTAPGSGSRTGGSARRGPGLFLAARTGLLHRCPPCGGFCQPGAEPCL